MDVLVLWKDGTINVVSSNELMFRGSLKKGTRVKMLYENVWYSGKIIDTEYEISEKSDSSEDETLAQVRAKILNQHENALGNNLPLTETGSPFTNQHENALGNNLPLAEAGCPFTNQQENNEMEVVEELNSNSEKEYYDSDVDPPYAARCEAHQCKKGVFSSCHRCMILLCYNHFMSNPNCENHTNKIKKKTKPKKLTSTNISFQPEQHKVEGTQKEGNQRKKDIFNKQKLAKALRNSGKEYVTVKKKKTIPCRRMKPRCSGDTCKKQGRLCSTISDSQRSQLFDGYYALADINRQRHFIVQHVEVTDTKQKTSNSEVSRRQKTYRYCFSVNKNRVSVCKTFFFKYVGHF